MINDALKNVYGLGKISIYQICLQTGINTRKKDFVLNKNKSFQVDKQTKLKILDKKLRIQTKNSLSFEQKIKTYNSVRTKNKLSKIFKNAKKINKV